jgi:flagellar basal-body rod protein FlgC
MLEQISAREIAVSGMKVQRQNMDVIANNVANMNTTRTDEGEPFRRQMVIVEGEQLRARGNTDEAGVSVKRIASDPAPFRMVHDPSHPDANEKGYVAFPNVDLSVEMVNLVVAQRAYEASVAVFASDRRMSQQALDLIRQ